MCSFSPQWISLWHFSRLFSVFCAPMSTRNCFRNSSKRCTFPPSQLKMSNILMTAPASLSSTATFFPMIFTVRVHQRANDNFYEHEHERSSNISSSTKSHPMLTWELKGFYCFKHALKIRMEKIHVGWVEKFIKKYTQPNQKQFHFSLPALSLLELNSRAAEKNENFSFYLCEHRINTLWAEPTWKAACRRFGTQLNWSSQTHCVVYKFARELISYESICNLQSEEREKNENSEKIKLN